MKRAPSHGISPARAAAAVSQIMLHHFGARPARLEPQHGGLSNLVFSVRHKRSGYIVRLNSDPAKLHPFLKEQWACAEARRAGVPVPDILEVGSDPLPYMIQAKSRGEPATDHSERLRVLCDLGRYAARIHSIRTHGFGATFDWSHNHLSTNARWPDFLRDELHLEERLALLNRYRMASAEKLNRLRRALRRLPGARRSPALNHGDLRLKNVLVDDKGRILTILDWENCISAPAPEWDLSIALHDLSIDEKESFLKGYGLRPDRLRAISPILQALNLVNYAPKVSRLAARKETAELARYRARLSGALDLYSL